MNGFDLSTISNCYIGGTQASAIYKGNTKIWPTSQHNYSHDYFTIQSLQNNNNINIVLETDTYSQAEIEYSYNGGTWTTAQLSSGMNTLRTINNGDIIRLRGFTPLYPEQMPYIQYTFDVGSCKVYGNLSSLWYEHIDTVNSTDNYYAALNETSILTNESYYKLFYRSSVFDALNLILPATTLRDICYTQMFQYCDDLIYAPLILPATTLEAGCYWSMFEGCTSLTTAPELPATTLASSCYNYMFEGCTSLTTAPALPATTLAQHCYKHMFYGCTSLTTAPELPATTLAEFCYDNMFYGCTSLTTAPELPATTLILGCYMYMFYGCTSLTTAPELPATTLVEFCYSYMFKYCTSLTTAPALPATTLAQHCYKHMFYGCTSLTTAPELPATTLTQDCYFNMFNGCKRLNAVTCLATDISASGCTINWLNNVASTGTFTKATGMTDWTTGRSGIPTNWTVVDYNPQHDYSLDYFTIESLEDNNEIQFYKRSSSASDKTIQWSTDGTTWSSYTSSTSTTAFVTLNTGDKVMIKGTNTQYANDDTNNTSHHIFSTKTINVYGNIMSLLYGDNFVGQTSLTANYTFRALFWKGKIVDASNLVLPATTLTQYCYRGLFDGNASLIATPKVLPAMTLANYCYMNMFIGCSSLTSVPSDMLPATTLAPYCYQGFLANCTQLVNSPELPAPNLANYCYQSMYQGCANLKSITCLATNTSVTNPFYYWVYQVGSGGTFTKKSGVSYSTGIHGIPSGWTVVNVS